MEKHTSCLLCNSQNLKQLKSYYNKHKLVKCKECGFVFIENIPAEQELNSYYSVYSYGKEDNISPLTISSYNKLLDEFEEYRKTNKILDVGSGRGWFLNEARKRGWQIYGTEYSDSAIKLCKELGIEMKKGKLDHNQFTFSDFDVITSFEVLEHINNPSEEVSNIYKLLRTGGLFYCTTPNFNSILRYHKKENYRIIAYPEHLSYFTKRTLNYLLEINNFKLKKFLSTGISFAQINISISNKTGKSDAGKAMMSDEDLRNQIYSKKHLKIFKNVLNKLFTLTNTGLTLKGYYVKK